MHFDTHLLSRLQLAFTIAFHIIFPSFTIGLASFLAVLEGLWLATRREAFKALYLFWVRIFAISFGMGVVTGVVMSYEIGTNWSVYSAAVAPVIGPTFLQPNSITPRKLASRKKAVSTSKASSGPITGATAAE
jgi:cytochrome d ubiquinol oxidase subunit I